jgi:CRP-like cAMP-binding protein
MDRISLLLGTYLFQGLSPAELEPLARSAMTRHAARGEYVHHVGDPADEIYLVAAGQLKDSIVTEEGDELVHTFYGPGMLIGEPGFFATERNRVMALVAVETRSSHSSNGIRGWSPGHWKGSRPSLATRPC